MVKDEKKKEKETKSFWKKLKKNPPFMFSIVANIIFILLLGLGIPFGVYPYLMKKAANFSQQTDQAIFKKLYKKTISRVEYDIIDNNDTMARVMFNRRFQEKYGIKVLSDWEMDQDDIKQALKILATNQVKNDQIKYWVALGPKYPVQGKFSSRIGTRLDPVALSIGGDPTIGYHNGLDIKIPSGTEITPFLDGIVLEINNDPTKDLGKYIKVDHGDGLISIYGHLSHIKTRKGHPVFKSQIIGLSGNTGRTTGDHLHFQINLNGQSINPERFFKGIVEFI